MTWGEYALSRLQLAEISIPKLIPKLPAISKGLCTSVNFASHNFDKDVLGQLSQSLQENKCKLDKCKLSIYSIQNLDDQVSLICCFADSCIKMFLLLRKSHF